MSGFGKESTSIRKVTVQDYNLKELAAIYNTSKYKMRNKLKKVMDQLGEKEGYEYKTEQVKLIFVLVPLPSNVLVIQVKPLK